MLTARLAEPIKWFAVKDVDYEKKIKGLDWPGLRQLFSQIRARDTPGWAPGKACEYLVPRAFELTAPRSAGPMSSK